MPFRRNCGQQVYCKCWLCMLAQLTDLFALCSSEAKFGSVIQDFPFSFMPTGAFYTETHKSVIQTRPIRLVKPGGQAHLIYLLLSP